MLRSLYAATSGMQAQQLTVDTLANNLANVNTSGYKKARVDFQDLLYQVIRRPGDLSFMGVSLPTGIQVGHGVRVAATQTNFTQGNLQQTGNSLDLAIEGDGFFMVELPDGSTAYTRDGSLKLDGEGYLVTTDGYLILPGIQIDPEAKEITVASDGTVSVLMPGEAEPEELGQIELARFINPSGLQRIGKNLLIETPASGMAETGVPGEGSLGTINQGFLEMSNVQVIEEMVQMITAQRAYEINSKVIQSSDDMLGIASNLRR